ncbi:predicted protein [Naegleria gruberi]|uniref:Predicted protein n=1 Tax=Naegleria gruberi TaxID=5762 RepID=D2V8D0_NAEGR|nr:uncharacterized protein NAEGRDRAFT_47488 [Naegleria gruberi]EFC47022.1 predicted protein [Naegleria gruberi]|eukprot:XP_002679766.1 predicted protein [Naegleria gruberi strain NEG-M]
MMGMGNLDYAHPEVKRILRHHSHDPKTFFVFEPPIDVREHEKKFIIHADVPGFHKNNISVTVTDEERGEICIKGNLVDLEEKQMKEEEQVFGKYLIQERVLVPEFERKVVLHNPSEIDWDNINASIAHGQLNIDIPKKDVPSKPPKESKIIPISEEP